jgi:tRNA U34 5-carboxymethylaminomethyl modifying enzyme MnmG/GidA
VYNDDETLEQIEIRIKYEGYIQKAQREAEKMFKARRQNHS